MRNKRTEERDIRKTVIVWRAPGTLIFEEKGKDEGETKKRRKKILSAVGDRLDKSQDFGEVEEGRREEKEMRLGRGFL